MNAIQMAPLRLAVMFMQAGEELAARAKEDRGEIGSWLVLAAGLALLAAFAGEAIVTWVKEILDTLTGVTPAES